MRRPQLRRHLARLLLPKRTTTEKHWTPGTEENPPYLDRKAYHHSTKHHRTLLPMPIQGLPSVLRPVCLQQMHVRSRLPLELNDSGPSSVLKGHAKLTGTTMDRSTMVTTVIQLDAGAQGAATHGLHQMPTWIYMGTDNVFELLDGPALTGRTGRS